MCPLKKLAASTILEKQHAAVQRFDKSLSGEDCNSLEIIVKMLCSKA